MIRICLVVFIAFVTLSTALAQDTVYARQLINTLAGPQMHGRGYVNQGDKKAAQFIVQEFKQLGIEPLVKGYYQNFSFPMNTYPGEMYLALDKKELKPVADYVISPNSKSINNTFPLVYLPEAADTVPALLDSLKQIDFSGKFLVAPFNKINFRNEVPFKAAGILIPKPQVYWWASNAHELADVPVFHVIDTLLKDKPIELSLTVEHKFIKNYQTQNVLAYIKGAQVPDSFVVFTAHYDHLGMMGAGNIFWGANDNASGTAMVLALAKYFSQPENSPKYSIAFMLFAAEESGLLGSKEYVENPVFPLKQIKSLINLDMVGSGSEGIALINGEANPELTAKMEKLNEQYKYFTDIRIGKESCNSDHCHFHKAGVPALFIFTRGPECREYHNLNDTPANTPLSRFFELHQLLSRYAGL
jgi:hypothetical protein